MKEVKVYRTDSLSIRVNSGTYSEIIVEILYDEEETGVFKERFDEAVRILAKLLRYCSESDLIQIEDPELTSQTIIYILDGLKMSRTVQNLSEEEVNRQLNHIKTAILNLK